MRVVEPIVITDSLLTSSTVAEPDTSVGEATYVGATTYDTGDLVVVDHRLYRSLIDSNTGNNPPDSPNEWLELGASNRFKPFDYLTTQQSVGASPYVVEITPAQVVGGVVVTGLVADEIQVRLVRPGDDVIYDQTRALSSRSVATWSEYFTTPFDQQAVAIFMPNQPFVTDAVVEITITRTSGDVSVTNIAIGRNSYIGATEYGGGDDALDFSIITRDAFGGATLTPGRVVPTLIPPVFANKSNAPAIRRIRERTAGTPTVWIGVDDPTDAYFDSHFVFGIWRRFRIDTDFPENCRVDLELENI